MIPRNNESPCISSVRTFVNHVAGDNLVVRVWDFDADTYTAEFNLLGINWALNQLPCW